MRLTIEGLSNILPHYLSAPRREGVVKALNEFPEIKFFYLNAYANEILQGDCWSRLVALDFNSGERRYIRGVVLSNSCDIDPSNPSVLERQLIFVPLIRLPVLEGAWRRAGMSDERINSTFAAVRRQGISSFFYLPQGANVDVESVAWLDQIHTMPMKAFEAELDKKKIATLTDPSFYLFILKLSIHMCRLQENVDRSEAVHAV